VAHGPLARQRRPQPRHAQHVRDGHAEARFQL
jgi:hypothetical protein